MNNIEYRDATGLHIEIAKDSTAHTIEIPNIEEANIELQGSIEILALKIILQKCIAYEQLLHEIKDKGLCEEDCNNCYVTDVCEKFKIKKVLGEQSN